ncbi:MAG: SDR family oxidoreductase [Candidatus Acidiferrales bacterium]|jgi:NAD(P)-dependent dehydrogenase (short-subunit alcohol dehydrogenase family)
MTTKMNLANRTAVLTGAASGIGRAIAVSLARRGCNLALADVNDAGLSETARLAQAAQTATHSSPTSPNPLRITQHHLDVGDRRAVAAFPHAVLAAHPGVDLLINNAGVAIGGTFEAVSEEDFEWLFAINFWGVVRMTRAFLPLLKKSDDARLVNLSSVFGLISPPGQTAYSASKFAVRGFSNSLRHELQDSHVGVTVVHPGGVATSIADNARVPKDMHPDEIARRRATAKKGLRMPPPQAGEIIVKGIERRSSRILVGNDAKLLSFVERLAPKSHFKVLSRLFPKP